MTLNGWIQIAIYCALVLALVKPLGWYMTAIFNGERKIAAFALFLLEYAPMLRGPRVERAAAA